MSGMMITIDKMTGTVNVDGYQIKPSTKLAELPESFMTGQEMTVQVIREKVPCTFSSFIEATDSLETKVNLRFERDKLVSVFIHLTDLTKSYKEAADFYSSTPERKQMHLDWLQSKLGKGQDTYTSYQWGKVGVAQDRSDNVHIFIHNQNNTWAL
ncbi:hypothetical protein L2725_15410 [Shewanella corallii]|uniref:Uncharacterized protein n=1 Tax=Shewanella corallii TaxID=560080 RepID=A0ABT0N9K2_9GAMM|nr:hypothetical protein [Shewanella corallii]MCL2915147.1 hypothetical protein [Shewanella corallii]